MRSKLFGPQGFPVPVLGLGTWNMERDDRAAAIAALQRGIELGITHIDTAELYGYGQVETLVGEAIRGQRDRVFLVSKVMPKNASKDGTVAACERSLARLGTDHLDLFLLHWAGPHPIEEAIAGFEELVLAGKIRAFGVSNFDVHQMEEVFRVAGPGKLACNQVIYHLNERAIEHEIISWCEAHRVAVVAYSPFGSGRFPGPRSPGGHVLAEVAKEVRATPHQVALAFLTRHPSVFAIPKTSTPSRVEQIYDAAALELSEAQLRALDEAFPLGVKPGSLPTI